MLPRPGLREPRGLPAAMSSMLVKEGRSDGAGTWWYDLCDRRSGAIRRLFVWVPQGSAPEGGWPALWLLDGNAVIGSAVDALRTQAFWPEGTNIHWGVLIAVGYPTEEPFDFHRRSWDLGPPPGRTYPPFTPGGPEVHTGGGAELARFMIEDALEFLADRVPLNPDRQALYGHSLGGVFVLWLLLTQPSAFRSWIAASPEIAWEGGFVLEHLRSFDPGSQRPRVHISAGEWEGTQLAPFEARSSRAGELLDERARIRIIETAIEMTDALQTRGVEASFELFPAETHMSVLTVAVGRAIRIAFGRGDIIR